MMLPNTKKEGIIIADKNEKTVRRQELENELVRELDEMSALQLAELAELASAYGLLDKSRE